MSSTLTHETVTIAADVRSGDDILTETHNGAEWLRVRSVSHRGNLALIVRADGFLGKYAATRAVFVRRSVTR